MFSRTPCLFKRKFINTNRNCQIVHNKCKKNWNNLTFIDIKLPYIVLIKFFLVLEKWFTTLVAIYISSVMSSCCKYFYTNPVTSTLTRWHISQFRFLLSKMKTFGHIVFKKVKNVKLYHITHNARRRTKWLRCT